MDDHPAVVTAIMVGNATTVDNDGSSDPTTTAPSSNLRDETMIIVNNNNNKEDNDVDVEADDEHYVTVTQAIAPSHILEDGRFIYLPPPNAAERSRFFERSIARYGLLENDMMSTSNGSSNNKNNKNRILQDTGIVGEENDGEESGGPDKTEPKIHPLAIASARIQTNGLNELNRAINLATLVSTGEYFTYSNVVDPSLESTGPVGTDGGSTVTATAAVPTTATPTTSSITKGTDDGKTPTSTAASTAATTTKLPSTATTAAIVMTQHQEQERLHQTTVATYCLKRKRTQFEKASTVLHRHVQRLEAAVAAQRVLDQRLFQLRQQWRLVAPEHGTRARLHATRTNEVIAVDVDVYDRDRVVGGGGSGSSSIGDGIGARNRKRQAAIGLAGRLASRVPRFATIELKDGFKASDFIDKDKEKGLSIKEDKADGDTVMEEADREADVKQDNEKYDEESPDQSIKEKKANVEQKKMDRVNDHDIVQWTRAEPFAVADPTLGRVMENFDLSKIPMLNLQLEIQKSSTGFLQSARLEPLSTTMTTNTSSNNNYNNKGESTSSCADEDLLISLQHSLFCANLFESIRTELDPDNYANNDQRQQQFGVSGSTGPTFSPARNKTSQSLAWLASESEQNFVPPPSFLIGGDDSKGLAALSVVHCHEGEVKVQLDCEYTLCVRLVEANAEEEQDKAPTRQQSSSSSMVAASGSGSQSPAQLHALCRALLLHAQEVYHEHSLYLRQREKKKREEEAARGDGPRGLARIKKEDIPDQARILQSCVSLGSKMQFERRIRKTLSVVSKWVRTELKTATATTGGGQNHDDDNGDRVFVEWLPLSIFDLHSRFTVCFRRLVVDAEIMCDELTVTRITETGDYRKVHFHSETEFELYLKLAIQRHMT